MAPTDHLTDGQRYVNSMSQLLAAWGVRHEVQPVARLARVMHRTAIRRRNTGLPRWIAESRCMQRDASDLLDYARELKLRHTVNF